MPIAIAIEQYWYPIAMKTKKLILKLNQAEVKHQMDKVKELWLKLLKKSLKGKNTSAVK